MPDFGSSLASTHFCIQEVNDYITGMDTNVRISAHKGLKMEINFIKITRVQIKYVVRFLSIFCHLCLFSLVVGGGLNLSQYPYLSVAAYRTKCFPDVTHSHLVPKS